MSQLPVNHTLYISRYTTFVEIACVLSQKHYFPANKDIQYPKDMSQTGHNWLAL